VPGTEEWMVDEGIKLMVRADEVESDVVRRVGRHLVQGFFVNDIDAVEADRPRFEKGWAELKERMPRETHWNDLKLRRVLWAEIVAAGLPAAMVDKIKWTCLWMLHGVKDERVRRQLAERIAKGDLVGQDAEDAIERETAKTRGGGRLGGRPAVMIERLITAMERAFAAAMKAHSFDERNLGTIREPKARELIDRWRKVRAMGDEKMDKLEKSIT
jgi:hypothetical protein